MNNFTYKEIDYTQDLSQILELIQNNLDNNYSENFFKWKHMENPFGTSYGLLAMDNEKIVGLRMFMFWEFAKRGTDGVPKIIKAIRPVDTVTDKNYRGKGIFKKLTLTGLKNCERNYDIIFNTPNENSLPGYMKMGWKKIENSNNFKIGMLNPFEKSLLFSEPSIDEIEIEHEVPHNSFTTLKSLKFLKWRYKDPVYKIAHFRQFNVCVVYKKINIKGVNAFIIYEILGNSNRLTTMLNSLGNILETPLIYYYDECKFNSVKFVKTLKRKKALCVHSNDKYNINENLGFSLGDLEHKL